MEVLLSSNCFLHTLAGVLSTYLEYYHFVAVSLDLNVGESIEQKNGNVICNVIRTTKTLLVNM
jgi:hypothetical protein